MANIHVKEFIIIVSSNPQFLSHIYSMNTNIELKQAKKCPYCQDTALAQNEQSQTYCTSCGRVAEEINFAQDVTFGSNQKMEGQVINTNGILLAYIFHTEKDNAFASQKRLKKARAKMESLRDGLKIELDGDTALEAGMRVINYANSLNFFQKGKNIETYAAAAFYMTLRFIKQPYLLVDFSDRMNVNLFKLARCFLKLLRFLGFQNQLPLIDPSIYIHRYCKMLNLADKTKAVSLTAIKLVQRMKRDWMCQGRRPSSLCGAAILIATKIHDIACSTSDICSTVFVCDETIRRRLEQFKQTSVAKMTKEQFEKMDEVCHGDDQMDPPAFMKARMRSEQENIKRRIIEEIEAIPAKKDKMMEKIPWEQYRESLNIPEDILAKQVKGVEKEIKEARERYENSDYDSFGRGDGSENMSNFTEEDIYEEADSDYDNDDIEDIMVQKTAKISKQKKAKAQGINGQNNDSHDGKDNLSDIDQEQIEKFLLDDDERKMKKNLWIQHNQAWLEKEASKKKDEERVEKKKGKRTIQQKRGKDIIQSIEKTKLGKAVNHEELKRLIGTEPQVKKPDAVPSVNLEKMFNPFQFQYTS